MKCYKIPIEKFAWFSIVILSYVHVLQMEEERDPKPPRSSKVSVNVSVKEFKELKNSSNKTKIGGHARRIGQWV